MTETDRNSHIFPTGRRTVYFLLVVSDMNSTEKGYLLPGAKKSRIWNSVTLYIYNKISLNGAMKRDI